MVDRGLRGVERELSGQPAREDVLVALEPRVQMPAAVAELAQPLVRLSRPPVLLSPVGSLDRVNAPAAGAEAPAPTAGAEAAARPRAASPRRA
ncbi:MAG TPA: hypothetical protein VNR42_04165, partial [Solirubrobacteraceae bacterium]|nr:hypothetical protein [Solirubrobacteraceae bacterium]